MNIVFNNQLRMWTKQTRNPGQKPAFFSVKKWVYDIVINILAQLLITNYSLLITHY
mgnify:CR=1 FL=1